MTTNVLSMSPFSWYPSSRLHEDCATYLPNYNDGHWYEANGHGDE